MARTNKITTEDRARMLAETHCADCGAAFVASGCGTGYGRRDNGQKVCYACCAVEDRARMVEEGRATLYLSYDVTAPAYTDGAGNKWGERREWKVGNWPGSLTFKVGGAIRHGDHNIAGTRKDVWFTGPDGFRWWGVSYGDWTQICHCKRTKERAS